MYSTCISRRLALDRIEEEVSITMVARRSVHQNPMLMCLYSNGGRLGRVKVGLKTLGARLGPFHDWWTSSPAHQCQLSWEMTRMVSADVSLALGKGLPQWGLKTSHRRLPLAYIAR